MKKITSLGIGLLLLFAGLSFAHATPPLRGEDIQHFMDAMKPLQELGKKYDFEEDDQTSGQTANLTEFSPMSRSLEKVKPHEAYPKFQEIIHDAGFSSEEQWAIIGDRIMRAYMSLKIIENMTPEKIQEMHKSIAEIENNRFLAPEVKKKILDNLKQTIAMTEHMPDNIKADQETLQPYLTKLNRLFKE